MERYKFYRSYTSYETYAAVMLLLCGFAFPLHAEEVNSLGMQFVPVAAGSFIMGSCRLSTSDKAENARRQRSGLPPLQLHCLANSHPDPDAAEDEAPQHRVTISHPFALGRTEVTLAQFRRFIDETGRSYWLSDDFLDANAYGDKAPVVMVSWEQANAFIAWLNRREHTHRYRLPTEAEWEYAARAGTITPWSFQGRYSDYAWYAGNSDDEPHSVAQKRANPWGLYDMHGNAWEWVADGYDAQFYHQSPQRDPFKGHASEYRVVRGGGFSHPASDLRSANRGSALPDQGYAFVGFRILRDIQVQQ